MSTAGLESLSHTVQTTHEWINELDGALDWANKARSYRLLRTVLHALRDWLPVNEAVDLGAQLPTLIRGVYYEQWRPATTPVKPRDIATFLTRIDRAFDADPIDDVEWAVSVVFTYLSRKISDGEIRDVKQALPAALRELWSIDRSAA